MFQVSRFRTFDQEPLLRVQQTQGRGLGSCDQGERTGWGRGGRWVVELDLERIGYGRVPDQTRVGQTSGDVGRSTEEGEDLIHLQKGGTERFVSFFIRRKGDLPTREWRAYKVGTEV